MELLAITARNRQAEFVAGGRWIFMRTRSLAAIATSTWAAAVVGASYITIIRSRSVGVDWRKIHWRRSACVGLLRCGVARMERIPGTRMPPTLHSTPARLRAVAVSLLRLLVARGQLISGRDTQSSGRLGGSVILLATP